MTLTSRGAFLSADATISAEAGTLLNVNGATQAACDSADSRFVYDIKFTNPIEVSTLT